MLILHVFFASHSSAGIERQRSVFCVYGNVYVHMGAG